MGEIGLDHVRVRQDKGRDQQAEVFSRVCRLPKEVGKPVVIHCRGTASTTKECLWIMKSNLPKDQMVYWHHFNETEEMARKVEAPQCCAWRCSGDPEGATGWPTGEVHPFDIT